MSDLFGVVLAIHVLFAIGCAIAMWPPLLSAKGGRFHKKSGGVFAALLFLATSTSILVTAMRAMLPAGPLGHGGASPLDAVSSDHNKYYAFIGFLVFIALATTSAGWFGLKALGGRRRPLESACHAAVAVLGLAAVVIGAWLVVPPMIAVGAAGIALGGYQAIKAVRPDADRAERVKDHLTGMIAGGIGAYSALAVVIGNRVAPEFFHSYWGVIIWLVPAIIGLPAILVIRARA